MATFQSILGNATQMDNGFIVLEHDLYEQTVDLAIGYTLPAAQSHSPAFTVCPTSLSAMTILTPFPALAQVHWRVPEHAPY